MLKTTTIQIRPALRLLLALTLLLPGAAAFADKRTYDPGLYMQKYIRLISTKEPWLEHPTGEYVRINNRRQHRRHYYEVDMVETNDMDSVALDLADSGYVLIGFSMFNTREGRKTLRDDATYQSMTPGEQFGYRLGMRLGGANPNAGSIGEVRDAARTANAAKVVLQRNYSFSRTKSVASRIVASDSNEQTSKYGNSHATQHDERVQNDGTGTFTDTLTSSNSISTSDHVTHRARQWATVMNTENVDHYDYLATFWKKAKPNQLVLGALTTAPTPELRQAVGTRAGRLIDSVVAGTPAYYADLWEGDLLLEIDGQRIMGKAGWEDLLKRSAGRSSKLLYWRNGEFFETQIILNSPLQSAQR